MVESGGYGPTGTGGRGEGQRDGQKHIAAEGRVFRGGRRRLSRRGDQDIAEPSFRFSPEELVERRFGAYREVFPTFPPGAARQGKEAECSNPQGLDFNRV